MECPNLKKRNTQQVVNDEIKSQFLVRNRALDKQLQKEIVPNVLKNEMRQQLKDLRRLQEETTKALNKLDSLVEEGVDPNELVESERKNAALLFVPSSGRSKFRNVH